MFSPQVEIILIAVLVSVTCAIPGVFLVLRKMSLMSDAISHSILLGIVLSFFIVKDLASPLLIVGAAIVGLFTVILSESLKNTGKVKEDASIGLVFPLLFSIAVILISKFAGRVHIDSDAVIAGEIAFAPFNRLLLFGFDFGPKALWVVLGVLGLNLLYIILFYKELKLVTFDKGLAKSLGFSVGFMHYSLMGLVSLTSVGVFDVVGAILVVALLIAPAATAHLLTKKLFSMILLSALIGGLSAIGGYIVSNLFNASISGSIATMTGVFFILAFLFSPVDNRGVLRQKFKA